jgi:hypothetical protein
MQDIASVQNGFTAELVLVRPAVAVHGQFRIEYEKYFGKYGALAVTVTALVRVIDATITKVPAEAIITAR